MRKKEQNGDWAKISITQKMYGWSKYGGANRGLVMEELDEWYCQSCGNKQVRGLPAYMIDYEGDEREYVRVCSICHHNALLNGISKYIDWPEDLKRDAEMEYLINIANLLITSTILN